MNGTEKLEKAKEIIFLLKPLEALFLTLCEVKDCSSEDALSVQDHIAYTDGLDIFINVSFLENFYKTTVKDYIFIILHEILHVALGHCNTTLPIEAKNDRNLSLLYNIACDAIINYVINKDEFFYDYGNGTLLSKYGKTHQFKFTCPTDLKFEVSNQQAVTSRNVNGKNIPEVLGGILYDNEYRNTNLGIEDIYEMLKKKPKPKPKNGQGGDIQTSSNNSFEGDVQETDKPLKGDSSDNKEGKGNYSEQELQERKERLENIKTKAYNYLSEKQKELSERGIEIGNSISQITNDYGKVRNNWKKILYKYMLEYNRKIKSEKRFKRRSISRGYYWKGYEKQPAIKLSIGIDTSASVSNEELKDFASSINYISKHVNIDEVNVIYCDTVIQKVEKYNGRKEISLQKFYGRGGTEFDPVFEYINDNKLNPNLLIYFTDMGCYAPKVKRKFHTIWASTQPVCDGLVRQFKHKKDKIIFVDVGD